MVRSSDKNPYPIISISFDKMTPKLKNLKTNSNGTSREIEIKFVENCFLHA